MPNSPRQLVILKQLGVDVYVQKPQSMTAFSSKPKMQSAKSQLHETAPIQLSEKIVESSSPSPSPSPTSIADVNTNLDAKEQSHDTVRGATESVNFTNLSALQQHVSNCQSCQLANTRSQTVFGVGVQNADWFFVGEAPGQQEDREGEPFIGNAGHLLDAMIGALGLTRQQVYITNAVKCHPPENREPDADELIQCRQYLAAQIELVAPKVIVALGKVSAQLLTDSTHNIAQLRAKTHAYGAKQIPLVVTYHPAYLLRRPQDKALAWQDLCLARSLLAHA